MTTPKHVQVQKEFDAFKKKVVDVATRLAKEHEWCEVVNEALRNELGLDVPTQKVRIVLEMDVPEDEEGYGDLGDLKNAKEFIGDFANWGVRSELMDGVVSSEVFTVKG